MRVGEKAGVEGALNNAKRPSDDVVQTAPVKCRYTQSGICANIAGCCLCRGTNFALIGRVVINHPATSSF
jgi:hypothetical protein